MRRPADLSLYLVTDEDLARGRDIVELVARAIDGGVTCVQVRAKSLETRTLLDRVRAVRAVAAPRGVPVLVNDRLDVALVADADGVHLGQDDLPAAEARRLLGPERILGVTAGDPEAARRAEAAGADYIGTSAVYPTATKADAGPGIGLAAVRAIVSAVGIPVVGIGGIGPAQAAAVIAAGAAGIAVVSAIVSAPDPRAAAADLATIVRRAQTERDGSPRTRERA
jgi:thiamine-phosphate pyrophosphorylase